MSNYPAFISICAYYRALASFSGSRAERDDLKDELQNEQDKREQAERERDTLKATVCPYCGHPSKQGLSISATDGTTTWYPPTWSDKS